MAVRHSAINGSLSPSVLLQSLRYSEQECLDRLEAIRHEIQELELRHFSEDEHDLGGEGGTA